MTEGIVDGGVGTRVESRPSPARDGGPATGRRRRPTGAPPPLPRKLGASGKMWLVLLVLLLAWVPAALTSSAVRRVADRADTWFLEGVVGLRTGWLTDLVNGVNRLGSGYAVTAVAVALIVALIVFRRWRHLIVFGAALVALELLGGFLYDEFSRPRPFGVTIIGRWAGFSLPSPPVAVLSAILVGIAYTLVVPGRPRTLAKWIIALVIAVFVAARLYLAVDAPSDVILGVTLGVAIPLLAFRFFVPNEVFPVAYRKGKTAHLDVGGKRGRAIRRAVQDQLGFKVLELGHIGLSGSGGSTPIRMKVAGDPDEYLFAKLYAMNHVRADRWYKLGRTLLYGRLEDETSFHSVRRLCEHEDYAARLFRDAGLPTARSCGVVELTPSREYLLVTEFLEGAQEISEVEVDDQIIDEGLLIVRHLWDAGLAHRDIKPANILVRDGHVAIIDVAFSQVRPSPWRQAVDLANMMLVLAVQTDPQRVYARALQFFTPDDIAEAFAAARGVASPSQLRSVMKQDGRALIEEFRALAPERRPIPVQRWGVQRVAIALALLLGTLLVVTQAAGLLRPAHDITLDASPDCGTSDTMVLMAQAVPSAVSVPCIATLPAGWQFADLHVGRGRTTFSLDSDLAGDDAVEVTFTAPDECDVADAEAVPSDEVGASRYELPRRLTPELRSTRFYRFLGGCVRYDFAFDAGAEPSLVFAANEALAFQARGSLADEVKRQNGLVLCGPADPCPGGDGQ